VTGPIHVLIVDDSAIARMELEDALTGVAGIRVSLAGDGFVAQARIRLDPPDVVVLDLELQRMPGLDLLHWLVATQSIPVVICSSRDPSDDLVMRALDAGAAGRVGRPQKGALANESARQIADGVRAAHRNRRTLVRPAPLVVPRTRPVPVLAPSHAAPSSIVVAIGASTGGTEALAALLPALPAEFPGIVIVQHMPAGFTRAFAERLDRLCAMRVREAAAGDRIEDGLVLIAPGGFHTQLARQAAVFVVEVFDGPTVSQHRPSVDVLFHSVARIAGRDALGVIMTGMGSDGAAGLAAMQGAGACTLGQDEASSTVYGMPRAAAELGAVGLVAALDALPGQMIAAAQSLRRTASQHLGWLP
jgi:two-component system chemotaxis response regulator CheB